LIERELRRKSDSLGNISYDAADKDKLWNQQYYKKLWNQQYYKKLLKFKRKNGHCMMVTQRSKEDKSLGQWVSNQRTYHNINKMRLDRKERLDEIGIAWKAEGRHYNSSHNDQLWHLHYEQLVEFKRKHGHCRVPQSYEQDISL
jgi:hypothetical protein